MASIARSSGQSTVCATSRMVGACTCGLHDCAPGHANEVGLPKASSASSAAPAEKASSAAVVEGDLVLRFEEWEEWDQSVPLWRHAVAGSCAGVVEHIGMYPLDTIKTHMQALRPGGRMPLGAVIREISAESPLRFMRGATAIASGCIPAHIALFTSYETTKRGLLREGEHEPMRAAFCGATSTFCHDMILTPMDVVKQRMQLGCYSSIGECLRHVRQREGVAALYRSMPTTLAMNVPFGSVLVAVNESVKLHLGLGQQQRQPSLIWYFLSAGLSGAVASAATQPLDVIKTRLQTQDILFSASSSSSSSPDSGAREAPGRPKYSGFRSAFSTIVREEGLLSLYQGLLPRMLHAIPAAAMCWGTYETVKSFLGA